MQRQIDIQGAFRFGWETTKNNLGLLLGVMFVTTVIPTVLDSFSEMYSKSAPLFYALTQVSLSVLSMFLSIGFFRILLSLHDKQEGQLAQLFSGRDLLLYYVAGSILYTLIIFGGMLLLIVPGVILAIKYQFCSILIVDRHMRPVQALKESSYLTDGLKWNLFQFFLVAIGINTLGILCLGVGVLVSIPVTSLAVVYVYRGLEGVEELGDEGSSSEQ